MLLKTLETAQSRGSNCTSNVWASWPKKILLWVSYNSNSAPSSTFSVKRESCFMVQAIVPLGYSCLSCSIASPIPRLPSTATKHSLAFRDSREQKKRSNGPAPSWKLLSSVPEFRFRPGYQVDKFWCVLLSSGPTCRGWWLKSISLFLHHSNCISVALFTLLTIGACARVMVVVLCVCVCVCLSVCLSVCLLPP